MIVKASGNAGEFRGAAIAVRNILRREGVNGLFAGYGSFLLRDLPFDAIEFVAYEQLKSMYKVGASDQQSNHKRAHPSLFFAEGAAFAIERCRYVTRTVP